MSLALLLLQNFEWQFWQFDSFFGYMAVLFSLMISNLRSKLPLIYFCSVHGSIRSWHI